MRVRPPVVPVVVPVELELHVVLFELRRVPVSALLRVVLSPRAATNPCETLDAWLPRMDAARATFSTPFDGAVAAAADADRLGWAFVAGYDAALHALDDGLAIRGLRTSFAVTEEGGGHPKALAARLAPDAAGTLRLTGTKRFVTLGTVADVLLVVAGRGEPRDGRTELVVLRVDAKAPGVTVAALPETPFAPEVPHAVVTFTDVAVGPGDVLPGDGWARWVKPFRTVEDLHVAGAALGYLAGAAARGAWSSTYRSELVATLCSARALAAEDASDPAVHVAVAGLFDALHRLAEHPDARWTSLPAAESARWTRDRALLSVASRVRALRLDAAWAALGT